jgi:hypothetical protein
VDVSDGKVPMCKGDDALGAACNDENACSVDDKCIPVPFPTPLTGNVACRGVASGMPCDDYSVCTDDDTCIEINSSERVFGSSILCIGEVVVGRACNDYVDCTVDDVCLENQDGFAECRGTSDACK